MMFTPFPVRSRLGVSLTEKGRDGPGDCQDKIGLCLGKDILRRCAVVKHECWGGRYGLYA
jgi:hypothetical protein